MPATIRGSVRGQLRRLTTRSRVSLLPGRIHHPPAEARCRSAAECQPQMGDDACQPCRPARPGWENIVTEPFSKNPPPTMRHLTNEPPRDHPQAYLLARARQIRDLSMVSAMDAARSRPAQGALGRTGFRFNG